MNRKDGFALVFAIIIMSIIMGIMVSFFAITTSDLTLANTTSNTICAYYLAEAGLAKKFVDLRGDNDAPTSGTIYLSTGNPGTYSVTVPPPQGGSYTLSSTGTYKNINKTISLTVQQTSCANYLHLTNSEITLILGFFPNHGWFRTLEIFRGQLHTNGQINMWGSPIFEGPVSSVASSLYPPEEPPTGYPGGFYPWDPPPYNPDFSFRDSLTLGAPSIALPTSSNIITPLKTAAQQNQGLYLTGDTTVTFVSNGTMKVTNAAKYWSNKTVPLPQNKALFVNDGNLKISGILKGQLTAGASRNIYVMGNTLYNTNPMTNPASTDMLALVSQNNVYISSNAPYSFEIDAYIVALNGSFTNEPTDFLGIWTWGPAWRGVLTMCGGTTQKGHGDIGYYSAYSGRFIYGWQRNYYHDTRMENTVPAYFPPLKDSDGRIVYLKTGWAEL